jgi:hypothetical protein
MEKKKACNQRTQHLSKAGLESREGPCKLQTRQPEPTVKSQGEEVMRRQFLFLLCGPEKVSGKLAGSKIREVD